MGKNGLFVGLNTIDVQFQVERYPGANQKAKAKQYGMYTGGPATNAAITFSHLGGRPHLISSFGKHVFTEITFKELETLGVRHTDITPERQCHPIFASVVTSLDTGERSVVSYHPDNHDYCDIALENIETEDTDIVLIDGFYLDIAKSVTDKIKGKATTVLDGGSWKNGLDKVLPNVDIAICSADFHPQKSNSEFDTIEYLKNMGIAKIAVTRGGEPILAFEDGHMEEIEVKKIIPVDTLGAGDVFHGAFCHFYSYNHDFKDAIKRAAEVAAHSCLYFGTRSWMEENVD